MNESNVLFVDFLRWEATETQEPIDGFVRLPFDGMLCRKDEVRFDEDWNLMMLVVSKISEYKYLKSFDCDILTGFIVVKFVDKVGYTKTKLVEFGDNKEYKTIHEAMYEICLFSVKIIAKLGY